MDIYQKMRYNRSLYENLYFLNIEKDFSKHIFKISGSTANVYDIKLYPQAKNICNCPDAFYLKHMVIIVNIFALFCLKY